MLYKRELKKILALFSIGLILAVFLFVYAMETYSGPAFRFGLNDALILLMVFCYPVGIVYGWRQILGIYNRVRRSDREHSARGGGKGYTTFVITLLNFSLAFILAVFFAWVVGVYNALAKLIALKRIGEQG